ncbi:MAG: hypothetical protein KDA84_06210, partial [Planctomycetaceae bacterium]|nr:hypothetical protein [Planctomycetaceae bacterium]
RTRFIIWHPCSKVGCLWSSVMIEPPFTDHVQFAPNPTNAALTGSEDDLLFLLIGTRGTSG